MPRVLCELPFASELINGVRFTEDRGQMISEEVTQDVAENFASIRGYKLVGKSAADAAAEAAAAEAAAAAATEAAARAHDGKRRGPRAAQ